MKECWEIYYRDYDSRPLSIGQASVIEEMVRLAYKKGRLSKQSSKGDKK